MKHCELQSLCCCFSPLGNLMWIYSLFSTNLRLHPSVFCRLWRNQCVPLELWLLFSVWFTPFHFPHSCAVSVWPFLRLFQHIYCVKKSRWAMRVGLRSPSKRSRFFWDCAFMWLDTLYHILKPQMPTSCWGRSASMHCSDAAGCTRDKNGSKKERIRSLHFHLQSARFQA